MAGAEGISDPTASLFGAPLRNDGLDDQPTPGRMANLNRQLRVSGDSTQAQLSSSWNAPRQSSADHRVGNDRLIWVIAMERGATMTVYGSIDQVLAGESYSTRETATQRINPTTARAKEMADRLAWARMLVNDAEQPDHA
jgi:hypothetical protein